MTTDGSSSPDADEVRELITKAVGVLMARGGLDQMAAEFELVTRAVTTREGIIDAARTVLDTRSPDD